MFLKKVIPVILMACFISCQPNDNLLSRVKHINTPFTITDSVNGLFAIADTIRFDTVTIKQFNLTEDLKQNGQYVPKTLRAFNCSPIGYFTYRKFIILLYEGETSEAGDGSPEVVMVILNQYHKVLDHRVILFEQAATDYSAQQTDYIKGTADGIVTVDSRKIEKGFIKDSLVMKRTTIGESIYMVSIKGNISEEIKNSKEYTNPRINEMTDDPLSSRTAVPGSHMGNDTVKK